MNSHIYKSMKIKFFVVISIIMVVLIILEIFGNYIFVYNENYEHVTIHANNLYKEISDKFSEEDFLLYKEQDKINMRYEKINNLFRNMLVGYDLTKIYTVNKLDNEKFVYLTYIEKNFNNRADYRMGEDVKENFYDEIEKLFKGEKEYVYDEPKLFSADKTVNYLYAIKNPDGKVIGALGFDIDASVIKEISSKMFIRVIGEFLVVTFVLFAILMIILYKFLNKIFEVIVYTDDLTKLKNRLSYEEKIKELNDKIKEFSGLEKQKIYLFNFDLNDLKFVNDNLGHLAGDEYIQESGKIIQSVFKDIGTTYRVGGDEFVSIVISDVSENDIKDRIETLEKRQQLYNEKGHSYFMSISVGYDYFKSGYDMNLVSVLKRADEKMYKDKKVKKLKIKEAREKQENKNL